MRTEYDGFRRLRPAFNRLLPLPGNVAVAAAYIKQLSARHIQRDYRMAGALCIPSRAGAKRKRVQLDLRVNGGVVIYRPRAQTRRAASSRAECDMPPASVCAAWAGLGRPQKSRGCHAHRCCIAAGGADEWANSRRFWWQQSLVLASQTAFFSGVYVPVTDVAYQRARREVDNHNMSFFVPLL